MKVLGMSICTPAVVYLVISILLILYVLFSLRSVMGLSIWIWTLVNVLVVFFWTFVLNAICAFGYKWVSWVLVLFPIVLILFSIMTNAY